MENTDVRAEMANLIHRGHMVSWVVQTIGGAIFVAGAGSGLVFLVCLLFGGPDFGLFLGGVLTLVVVPLWLASREAPRPNDEVRRHLGLPELGED